MTDSTLENRLNMDSIINQLKPILNLAVLNKIRIPILMLGNRGSATIFCQKFLQFYPSDTVAWVDPKQSNLLNNVYGKKADFVIGKEFNAVVFYFNQDSNINLLAALAGTVKAGGLFIIICEENSFSPEYRFEKRLVNILSQTPCINITCDRNNRFEIKNIDHLKQLPIDSVEINFEEQKQVIEKIKSLTLNKSAVPLVIRAQRGRGKSAALGIACANLLREENIKILVTAPSLAATTVLFKHFKLEARGKTHISFIAPDELSEKLPEAQLLIVDEAAALPTPTLKILLNNYPRIIFATTTQGYEGAGQSFMIRFKSYLNDTTPNWQDIVLQSPIRWSRQDLLEPLSDKLFILPSSLSDPDLKNKQIDNLYMQKIEQSTLANNENLLQQSMQLLNLAHYKTRPSDLQQLLNNPKYQVFVAIEGETLLAIAIAIEEGPIEKSLAQKIYQGERRPKGDFLPQSMIFHLEMPHLADKNYLRITRIAVLPQLQNQGIGSQLLKFVEEHTSDKYDFIGSSFGATSQLLRFWLKKDYKLLRIGHTRKASSAMHAALLMKSLSDENRDSISTLHKNFSQELQFHLSNSLNKLEPDVVETIYHYIQQGLLGEPGKRDWQNIYSFAFLNRSYEDCLPSLIRFIEFVANTSSNTQKLDNLIQRAIEKVLQQQSWESLVKKYKSQGKQHIQREFRSCIAQLFITSAPNPIKQQLNNNFFNKKSC